MATASVTSIMAALNATAVGHGYSCKTISWEDVQRANVNGVLSCVGPNISDVRLYEKSGKLLYTLRSQNWNERLGYISSDEVSVVTGNYSDNGELHTSTLTHALKTLGRTSSIVGVDADTDLYQGETDNIFSIRYQAVFLPVADDNDDEHARTEFCTDVYSYGSTSKNPSNLLLLCTPQGLSVQTSDTQKVLFHVKNGDTINRHWLEAEKSAHAVGGSQTDSAAEIEDALKRNKSVAMHIGSTAMGKRFNVQMLIQVPIKRNPERQNESCVQYNTYYGVVPACAAACAVAAPVPVSQQVICAASAPGYTPLCDIDNFFLESSPLPTRTIGTSNSARVSLGSYYDCNYKLPKSKFERDPDSHGTITVTMYYTVVGGIPSEEDIMLAITDMNTLYDSTKDRPLDQCKEITKNIGQKYPLNLSSVTL